MYIRQKHPGERSEPGFLALGAFRVYGVGYQGRGAQIADAGPHDFVDRPQGKEKM
jgi:hypothetical protein